MSWLQVVWLDHYSMLGYFLYTVVLGSVSAWSLMGSGRREPYVSLELLCIFRSLSSLGHT